MEGESLYRRTVIRETVSSRLLPEGSRHIRVYLPPGYTERDRYAVVYCQDGEDFFNFGRIATIAQRLILEEIWAPFAVVGVDVDKRRRTEEYAPDGARHGIYVRFWEEELMPFVESRFAFRTDPQGRVLAGVSLGAAASLALALRRPRQFPNVMAFSGAFDEAVLRLIRAAEDLSALRVWMVVGTEETAFATERGTFDFVALNRKAREELEGKGAQVTYAEKPGGHKWGFWQQQLPAGLAAFLAPEAATG